jgi:hypothetical protein
MAAVAGAGAPPGPLVVAGAPGVVPRAVGEHELHVGAEGGDGFFEDGLVVGEERVLGEGGEGFFYVVAEVYGAAALCGDAGLGVAFAEEEVVRGEVVEGGVGELAGAVEVVGLVEDLGAEGEAVGRGYGVVDVAGVDGDEGVEELCGAGEAIGPALAGGGVEDGAVVVEGFGERDGVEDGDALPGTEGDVVDPTAVGAADLLLGPFVDEEGRFEVLCFAGGVGYTEERVDGVAAAAVDDGAGGAEERSAEGGVLDGGFLVGEEAVAPGLEELGVEAGWSWLRFGKGEGGEGKAGGEGRCGGGGELQHLAAGEGRFVHRGNLRTMVWIPNYEIAGEVAD